MGYETFRINKNMLFCLNIQDKFYTKDSLTRILYSNMKSTKKNYIIISDDDLKCALNYNNDVSEVELVDFIRRIINIHSIMSNSPPNCNFYSYNQIPIYNLK